MRFGPPEPLFSKLLLGFAGGPSNVAPLTPPTLAPVLVVTASLGSYMANLEWMASNKTGSAGFGYRIYHQKDGGGYSEVTTTTSLNYEHDQFGLDGIHDYYVTPYNDAGEGTVSNDASITLPGESEGPVLLGPDNTANSQIVTDDFTLTWSAIPGAATYDIYASLTDSSYTLWVADVAALSLAVSFAASYGNANWWYVVAHDGAAHYSAESNHLECTPILPAAAARNSEDGINRTLEDSTSRTLEA